MSVGEFAARQARAISRTLNVCNAKGAKPILPVEHVTMRLYILVPAVFVFTAPAVAQNWQEYSYPDYAFRVTFPDVPQIETMTYQVMGDRTVEAHVYSVHRDNADFKVTVAELAGPGLEETAVIDHAIKMLCAIRPSCARRRAAPFLHDGEAAKQIWLHVEPIEAAHVAGRINAGEMHGAHTESLEIVQRLTL
jgi:hypothetical protein